MTAVYTITAVHPFIAALVDGIQAARKRLGYLPFGECESCDKYARNGCGALSGPRHKPHCSRGPAHCACRTCW